MKEISIPKHRVFSCLLASFLAGVFISSFFSLHFHQIYLTGIILIVLFLGLIVLFDNKLTIIIAFSSTAFLVGFLIFSLRFTQLETARITGEKLIGTIVSNPVIDGNKQSFFLLDEKDAIKVHVSSNRYPGYHYGDKISISGQIKKPENFSDFDWKNYLRRFGSTYEAKNPQIEVLETKKGNNLLFYLYNFKNKFEAIIKKNLPEPESSLATGLMTGSKEGFSDSLLSDFSRVGITHIIALSGFNVTIIIIFLTDIFLGTMGRKKIFVLSAMLIVLFVAMTGAAPSVIRAAIITLLITFGKTIGRRADMANLILLSAAIMVAANPYILRFDTGFQLSFLAFIGLVYFSPIVTKFLSKPVLKNTPGFIKSAAIETLSAQAFVLPLLLSSFGQISLIAPFANIIILPIVPLSMLFVFLSALASWIAPIVGQMAFLLTYIPLKYTISIAQNLSKLSLSAINISGLASYCVIIIYIFAIGLIMFRYHHEKQTTN